MASSKPHVNCRKRSGFAGCFDFFPPLLCVVTTHDVLLAPPFLPTHWLDAVVAALRLAPCCTTHFRNSRLCFDVFGIAVCLDYIPSKRNWHGLHFTARSVSITISARSGVAPRHGQFTSLYKAPLQRVLGGSFFFLSSANASKLSCLASWSLSTRVLTLPLSSHWLLLFQPLPAFVSCWWCVKANVAVNKWS